MVGEKEADLRLASSVMELNLTSPDLKLLPAELNNTLGRATGVLPKGWMDNSVWAEVWTEYSILRYDGIPYLRIDVTKQVKGHGQIQAEFDNSMLTPGKQYRLNVRARSPSRTPIKLGVRHRGAPYRYQHQASFQLEPGFKSQSFS